MEFTQHLCGSILAEDAHKKIGIRSELVDEQRDVFDDNNFDARACLPN